MSSLACFASTDIESRHAVCVWDLIYAVNIFWGFVANKAIGKIPACVCVCMHVCECGHSTLY